jgi:hypothetical protein
LLKEKRRNVPIGSILHEQIREYVSHPRNSELFNRVVSLRREVVETSTAVKRKINKLVTLNE